MTGERSAALELANRLVACEAERDILQDSLREAHRLISYSVCTECDRDYRSDPRDCREAHHMEALRWLKKNGGNQ